MRIFLSTLIVMVGASAMAKNDYGQWDKYDPALKAWYESVKTPDTAVPCCGESDAYWADSFEVDKDGNYVAIITDPRKDVPHRPEIPEGTKIVVPKNKINGNENNPTGHGVIFVRRVGGLTNSFNVFCYIAPGGV